MTIKLLAQKLGIVKIDISAKGGKIEFDGKPNIDPLAIIQLVQKQPNIFRFEGANKLKLTLNLVGADERLAWVEKLLKKLESNSSNKMKEHVA